MTRPRPRKLTPAHIRSAIFRLSNRLRQRPEVIYEFDMATRVILMQCMIDPEKAYTRLVAWVKTAEEIPTWEKALEYCQEAKFDLAEFVKLQGWKMDDLERLYHALRGAVVDIREGVADE